MKDSELFKFGIGLFETIKVIDKEIFLDEHLDRLFNSIETLNLNYRIEKNQLRKDIKNYIKTNNIKNKALRITIFDEGYTFSTRDIIYTEENYNKGFSLNICDKKRGESFIYKYKTCNYFENVYYKNLAKDNGFDDMIFIDYNNFLLEACFSNIFFIKDKKVFTPSEELYLLNGIIRQKIIKICKENNIEIIEEKIKKEKIYEFDFAFLSNSLMDVIKIEKIDDKLYNSDNKIFNKIKILLENEYKKY